MQIIMSNNNLHLISVSLGFVDLEVYTCTLICITFATGSAFKRQRCDKTCQPKVFYLSENVQFHSVDNLTIY